MPIPSLAQASRLSAVIAEVLGLLGEALARHSKRKLPNPPEASMTPSGSSTFLDEISRTRVSSSPSPAIETAAPTLAFCG